MLEISNPHCLRMHEANISLHADICSLSLRGSSVREGHKDMAATLGEGLTLLMTFLNNDFLK